MSKNGAPDPNWFVCPECGSEETHKHDSLHRVCGKCGCVFEFEGEPGDNG